MSWSPMRALRMLVLSCVVALGSGFAGCVPGPQEMPPEPIDYSLGYNANVSSVYRVGKQVIRDERGEYAASDIVWKDSIGNDVSLASLRGKVVVLNYWATWCTYCLDEMPLLEQMQHEYQSDSVVFIGVSVDNIGAPRKSVEKFIRARKFQYQFLVDPKMESLLNYKPLSNGLAIPQTFIIDRSGFIRSFYVGQMKKQDLTTAIRQVQ